MEQVLVENITPELAKEYLAQNTHNRNIRQRTVLAYAHDMASGNWRWNGEGIKFDKNGWLIDGQHRLLAIIRSGVTIRMLVVRGLCEGAQSTLDTGVNRQFADILKLRGEKSCASLAAAVRSVHLWDSGVRRLSQGGAAATVSQLLETLDCHPWLREVMPEIDRVRKNSHLPASVLGGLYLAFTQIDPEDAEFFFGELGSKMNQDSPQPIFMLQKSLEDNYRNVKGARNTTYLAAITVKAWNAFRAGDDIGVLRWRAGGANPESFPEPK